MSEPTKPVLIYVRSLDDQTLLSKLKSFAKHPVRRTRGELTTGQASVRAYLDALEGEYEYRFDPCQFDQEPQPESEAA